MAKKSRKAKGRNKGHLRSVPTAPKMPLQLVLNHRVVDSLALEFIQWLAPDGAASSDAIEILELIKILLSSRHATMGSSSATSFDVDGVDAAVEAIAAAVEEDEMADAVEDLLSALAVYIEFLDESGRWSGTDAAYEELLSFLSTPGGSEDFPGGRPIIVPALSGEEQDKAFNAMPLIQHASSLLEWVSDGKDVTTTGALRLQDVEAAAAAVGVNARGKRGAGRPSVPFGAEADHRLQNAPLEVSTMYDVPLLGDIWAALVRAGLLILDANRAVVGRQIASWNSTEAHERIRIRRLLTLFQLLASIGYSTDESPTERLDAFLLILLARGTDDNPMPVALLDEMAADVDDPQSSDLALRVRNKLAALATLGIVEADTSYRVAEVAIQCVASMLKIIEGEELLPDPDDDDYYDLDGATDDDDGDTPANVIPIHNSGSSPKHR